MGAYDELILQPLEYNMSNKVEGIDYPYPQLSEFLDYIQAGEYIAVGGRPMSGRTSFIDFTFVTNIYEEWLKQDPTTRKRIKILYFDLKEVTLGKKLERWVCAYLKQHANTIINTSTLNPNTKGKMYDLNSTENTGLIEDLSSREIEDYFDYFLTNVLIFKSGAKTCSAISDIVTNYMKSIGKLKLKENEKDEYKLDPEYDGQHTFVIVDNTSRILTEFDDFAMMNDANLGKKINERLRYISSVFNATVVAGVPSSNISVRNPKDTEPNYKEIGPFATLTDKVLIVYNPSNEGQQNYQGLDVGSFHLGKYNKLRTICVLRNTKGISNMEKPMMFIQETGTFKELPKGADEIERTRLRWVKMCKKFNI